MSNLNVNSFSQVALSQPSLNRLELSNNAQGVGAGKAAFSLGNISRNVAVRAAFAEAIQTEFGHNAKLPLGFKSGLTPLSAKTVQKIIVNSSKIRDAEISAARTMLKTAILQQDPGLKNLEALKSNPLRHDPQTYTALTEAVDTFVKDRFPDGSHLENLKIHNTPSMANENAENCISELCSQKPELMLIARGLAGAKFDTAWVNENRSELHKACNFYARRDNGLGHDSGKLNTMLEHVPTMFSAQTRVDEIRKDIVDAVMQQNRNAGFSEEVIRGILNDSKGETSNLIGYIRGGEQKTATLNSVQDYIAIKATTIRNSVFSDQVKNYATKQGFDEKIVFSLVQMYCMEKSIDMKKLNSERLPENTLKDMMKHVEDHYTERKNDDLLRSSFNKLYAIGLPYSESSALDAKIKLAFPAAQSQLPTDHIVKQREILHIAQNMVKNFEGTAAEKTTLNTALHKKAVDSLDSEIKDILGFDRARVSGLHYDAYLPDRVGGVGRNSLNFNPESVVLNALKSSQTEWFANNPSVLVYSDNDIASIVQSTIDKVSESKLPNFDKSLFMEQMNSQLRSFQANGPVEGK